MALGTPRAHGALGPWFKRTPPPYPGKGAAGTAPGASGERFHLVSVLQTLFKPHGEQVATFPCAGAASQHCREVWSRAAGVARAGTAPSPWFSRAGISGKNGFRCFWRWPGLSRVRKAPPHVALDDEEITFVRILKLARELRAYFPPGGLKALIYPFFFSCTCSKTCWPWQLMTLISPSRRSLHRTTHVLRK